MNGTARRDPRDNPFVARATSYPRALRPPRWPCGSRIAAHGGRLLSAIKHNGVCIEQTQKDSDS